MTSKEQLVEWMGNDLYLQGAAAHAEEYVILVHPAVKRGSEEFYALILERATSLEKKGDENSVS